MRDMRTGQSWGRRQSLKNWAIRICIRSLLVMVDRLPSRWLLLLGESLGIAWHSFDRRTVRRVRQQLALALPEVCPKAVANNCFRTAGINLARCLLLRRQHVAATEWVCVDTDALIALDSALAEGRGCVVVSPHFGPFEYTAAVLAEEGYQPAVVVRESYDPALNRLVDAHRHARGVTVIHRGRSNAARAVIRALREQRVVGILPDIPGRFPTRIVPLLDAFGPLAVGPEYLSASTGAPVLAVWLEPLVRPADRGDPRPPFRLAVSRLTAPTTDTSLTDQFAAVLSSIIRRAPEHWLWMGVNFQMFSPIVERTLLLPRERTREPLGQREFK